MPSAIGYSQSEGQRHQPEPQPERILYHFVVSHQLRHGAEPSACPYTAREPLSPGQRAPTSSDNTPYAISCRVQPEPGPASSA